MRILFVQKEGGIFGAENYQLKVIPGLIEKGIEIEFLRLYTTHQGGEGGDFIDQLHELRIKTYEINIGKYPTFKVLNRIKKIANSGAFDIVHTHLIHADFHLALIKKFLRLKPVLVSTKHGYDNAFTSKFGFDPTKQTNTSYFLISRWAEKRMDASFTISKGLRDFFIQIGLTSSKKMSLIHYGFDMPENFLRKGEKGFRIAPKQIIIAGRLIAFKGHELLLDAMKNIIEGNLDLKLIVAGTGELEESLKARVEKLGLDSNVRFIGYSKDVGAWMANSDAVIIPSISEGFGVVFLEAFSAKTPVVAWNVSAGNELIEDGETGFLVKPYEIEALGDQIEFVLNNENSELKESAYYRLLSYFNLDRMVEQTIVFYNKVID